MANSANSPGQAASRGEPGRRGVAPLDIIAGVGGDGTRSMISACGQQPMTMLCSRIYGSRCRSRALAEAGVLDSHN
jgi:hypothetical protein